jgi:hypothetical protein
LILTDHRSDRLLGNDRNAGMGYAAFGLAIIGFAVGTMFRLRGLLPIVALVLVSSIAFSLGHRISFLETALTIVVAQTILQGSYFLGLATRSVLIFRRTDRRPPRASPPPQQLSDDKERIQGF